MLKPNLFQTFVFTDVKKIKWYGSDGLRFCCHDLRSVPLIHGGNILGNNFVLLYEQLMNDNLILSFIKYCPTILSWQLYIINSTSTVECLWKSYESYGASAKISAKISIPIKNMQSIENGADFNIFLKLKSAIADEWY